jgi:hypothetical protein
MLIKFLSCFFILNDIPLSFYKEDAFHKPKLNVRPEEILNDNNLRHILETILGKHQFFQEWMWNEA